MNDDLIQAFQQIVADFDQDILNNNNLANIVADYYSFDRNPAVRNIIKTIVSEGYAIKISQLKTSKGNPNIDLNRYASEIEQSWGFSKERVLYVLNCIARSIGIFESYFQRLNEEIDRQDMRFFRNRLRYWTKLELRQDIVKKFVQLSCKFAKQGIIDAQFNLGTLYEYGIGMEQNYQEALKWYEKAAAQGDNEAQERIERLLKTTIIIEQEQKVR